VGEGGSWGLSLAPEIVTQENAEIMQELDVLLKNHFGKINIEKKWQLGGVARPFVILQKRGGGGLTV
jgi:hypothetical protein